jgi:protease PrsW
MNGARNLILIPLLSLLPCVLWLWYFASQSVYKRPSRRIILLTFLLGALVTVPAVLINLLLQDGFIKLFGVSAWTYPLMLFLIVGPVEELMKLLTVYSFAYRRKEFDEALDGVVYSAAAALGFAAVENIVYLAQTGPVLVLLRGPLTNPGHALFSAIWGLSLSRAKASPNVVRQRFLIILTGWLIASFVHGSFDLLLLAAARSSIFYLVILGTAFVGLFIWVRSRIRFFQQRSPHREGTLFVSTLVYCQECGSHGAAGSICSRCGSRLPEVNDLFLCPVCDTRQRPGARFCARCGANLKMPALENLDNRAHFVSVSPAGEERIAFILNRSDIQVGRTLNNEFVIEHPSVSKRHARVTAGDQNFELEDLGSMNGTFVNGKRVSKAMLEDGCEVRFGRANFVYRSAHSVSQAGASAFGKEG